MNENRTFVSFPDPSIGIPKTELETFASFFHQDYRLMFDTDREAMKQYLSSLSVERKTLLRGELIEFNQNNSGSTKSEIAINWYQLGAHGSPRGGDVKHFLDMVLNEL